MRALVLLVVTTTTAAVLCACGSSTTGSTSPTSTAASPSSTAQVLNVDGLSVDSPADHGSMAAIVSGVATIDAQGCWRLDPPGNQQVALVWPDGTHWTDVQHTAVAVPAGDIIRSGDTITGGGGFIEHVARSSVSVAADVRCLAGDPVSYAVTNADVKKAS